MTWYVVDGLDGSGKTTTAYDLKDMLEKKGHSVQLITHPDRNHLFGKLSARCLLGRGTIARWLSAGFFMINMLGSVHRMKRTSKDDTIFVRYTMSACYLSDRIAPLAYRILTALLPRPDVLIYKDVDENTALERVRRRGEDLEMFENIESLKETRARMLRLSDGWHTIDKNLTKEEVKKMLLSIIS